MANTLKTLLVGHNVPQQLTLRHVAATISGDEDIGIIIHCLSTANTTSLQLHHVEDFWDLLPILRALNRLDDLKVEFGGCLDLKTTRLTKTRRPMTLVSTSSSWTLSHHCHSLSLSTHIALGCGTSGSRDYAASWWNSNRHPRKRVFGIRMMSLVQP